MVKQLSLNLDGAIGQINSVNPVLARHETFHPRFGWLKKGFDAAQKNANNSSIFLDDDVPIRLGVGKNMVNAIRYWCNAFKVLEDDIPTEFGELLLRDNGWEPFLEDPASLWLLHGNLLKPPCNATAWYFTFNIFRQVQFSQDEFFNALCDYKDIAFLRKMRYDVTELNGVKNIET